MSHLRLVYRQRGTREVLDESAQRLIRYEFQKEHTVDLPDVRKFLNRVIARIIVHNRSLGEGRMIPDVQCRDIVLSAWNLLCRRGYVELHGHHDWLYYEYITQGPAEVQ